jgi:hypothetical protein
MVSRPVVGRAAAFWRFVERELDCFIIIFFGSPANNRRLYESKRDLLLMK